MASDVLVTRALDRAQGLIRQLQRLGIHAEAVPVTETVPLEPREPLPVLETFDWLVFSSRNAVKVFAEDLERAARRLPAGVRIAVVGPATGQAVEARWRAPDVVAERSSGAGLADALVQRMVTDSGRPAGRAFSVLWPCARRTTPGLARGLAQAGAELVPWPCYETVPIDPGALRERLELVWPWRACVFAAPSAVKAFGAAWPLPWRFATVAIGPTTAAALTKFGAEAPLVSDRPSPDALAIAVECVLNHSPSTPTRRG